LVLEEFRMISPGLRDSMDSAISLRTGQSKHEEKFGREEVRMYK
jgi:hypothetical protein